MITLPFGDTGTALFALAVIAVMFVLFFREAYPPEVVALGGAGVFLFVGLVPMEAVGSILSNPAPWTILFLFLILGGLVRTGALDLLTQVALRRATSNPRSTIVGLFAVVICASAVMNNTPVVAVMIPVVIELSRRLGAAPSRFLLPLSYFTLMGGMISLIGTSTNLLVDGVARREGLEPFTIFEIAPLGLAMVVTCGALMALFGRRLLPERESLSTLLSDKRRMKYFTEVAIPEDSSLIGRPVMEVELFRRDGMRVIDVLRGDASLRRDMAAVVIEAGDRVVLRTEVTEVLGFQQNKNLKMVDKLSSVQTETVEVLITPGCRMVGRSLGELRLRRRYGVYVLAAHRRNQNIGRKLDDLVVAVGDTLLLEGTKEDIKRLAEDQELVDITHPKARPYRRRQAPIAIGVLVGVVTLASLGVASIQALGFLGAVIILILRCVDAEEAFGFIDGRLLAMIFSMLAVGEAMSTSGAVGLIVDFSVPYLMDLPPWGALAAVYILTLIMTEFLSNNAVAVILTPIAIHLAVTLGYDPRPFAVAIMFAASMAFATPIGYQTNMMVYAPGGYRFTDYMRIGIPLDILSATVAIILIPILWPLT